MSRPTSAVINRSQKKIYDRIYLLVRKGRKELIRQAAEKQGQSLNKYIVDAIDERMEREL